MSGLLADVWRLKQLDDALSEALGPPEVDAINAAVEEHRPSEVYALFSGGHDSLCATHLAKLSPHCSGVIHCNTGIGIEQTQIFVRETCEQLGMPLYELHPEVSYEDLVLERGGFPCGPASHNSMLWHLKQKPLRKFVQGRKKHRHDRIGLITGIRASESQRRMAADISVPVKRDGGYLWVNPILDWSAVDKNRYIEKWGLPRNEVADLLHRSGECLCGALARREELKEIAAWYPEVAQRIFDLEQRAKDAGLDDHFWAMKSPVSAGQLDLLPASYLCWGCDAKVAA